MSSRVLRKLQGDDLEVEVAEEVDLVGRGARPKTNNINPFDLLNNDSCSESEVKEDDDLGTESSRSQMKREEEKKRKRKKKTKKAPTGHAAGALTGRNFPKSSEDNQEEFEDEIDRSVKEVNRILGEAPALSSNQQRPSSKVSTLRQLLSIEYRNLNPENEMKKIFGSKVVQAEAKHYQHHRHRGTRSRAVGRVAHSIIVPKGNWPNPGKSGGLSMKFVDSDSAGNQYFSFDHSQQYQDVQKKFFQAVESMNPDFIVQILNEHPFHVDSMLQLSDICKMGEDLQMATELIERTLFAQEAAFHPLFNLAAGTCRLDYKRQENRSFFIALFRHLNFVGSRACYRTALEFCKLIYSLDPNADPVGILLLVDFYAIRAMQYQWFVDVFNELDRSKNLSLLPNWAFSVSVAHFYVADEGSKDFTKADEMLQNALIMFPGVLLPLLDKCSIEAGKEAQHKYFLEASLSQSPGLEILSKLYIGRSYHIWKLPELLPWLERNTKKVVERVESKKDKFVKACEEKRRTRYQGAPRNVYRHVIMSDIQDATTSLPKELTATPVLSFDPLPPTDSIDLYTRTTRLTQIDDPSALRMFFRSLLPNFNPTEPVPEPEDGAEGGDLRSSMTTLYSAMQDLLGNLHLPEIPHDAGIADSEDSDDEEEQWQ